MKIRSVLPAAAFLLLAACGPVASPDEKVELQPGESISVDTQDSGTVKASGWTCCSSVSCTGGARCHNTFDAFGNNNGCYCG